MSRFPSIPAWAVIVLLLLSTCALGQEAKAKQKKKGGGSHGPGSAELNKQFLDPKLNVKPFLDRFEGSDREVYVHRETLGRLADLKTGQSVADIGAGTGLFSWPFAKQVGPEGRVYSVEISPAFIEYLTQEARKRGLDKIVKPIRGEISTTNLPEASIDVAFVCATYHHFEKPEAMLASIYRALRPGGRLIVIDFDLRPDSRDFVRQRARAPRDVYFREIEKAGFSRVQTSALPELRDNFAAVFRK